MRHPFRRRPRRCFVYIIVDTAGQRLKIGRSFDPTIRLEQAKTWIPNAYVFEDRSFRDVPAAAKVEALTFRRLAEYRIDPNREVFRLRTVDNPHGITPHQALAVIDEAARDLSTRPSLEFGIRRRFRAVTVRVRWHLGTVFDVTVRALVVAGFVSVVGFVAAPDVVADVACRLDGCVTR